MLQTIHSGDPSLLKELAKFPEIGLISFTGSTKVGISLREATADRMVPLNLELGGNDAAYVRADADINYVAAQLVDGAVFNSGQSCCSVERVYVHQNVHDQLVSEMQEELKGYVFPHNWGVRPMNTHAMQLQTRRSIRSTDYRGTRHITCIKNANSIPC